MIDAERDKHTFVVCAYKESIYLEDCLKSLKRQTVKTNIVIATSTPNRYVEQVAENYKVPLFVHEEESGMTADWDFAYRLADTPYVTLAHQDDIYRKDYAEQAIKMLDKSKKPLIFFSDYEEVREEEIVKVSKPLKVKRLLLSPFRCRGLRTSRFVRKRIFSLGNPICCSSVCFAKDRLPEHIFTSDYCCNGDWEAWVSLCKLKGKFIYFPKPLVRYRIHGESATLAMQNRDLRKIEDYEMYRKFWPSPMAKLLARLYENSRK